MVNEVAHQVECCVPLGQPVLKGLLVGAEAHGLEHHNVVIQLLAHGLFQLHAETSNIPLDHPQQWCTCSCGSLCRCYSPCNLLRCCKQSGISGGRTFRTQVPVSLYSRMFSAAASHSTCNLSRACKANRQPHTWRAVLICFVHIASIGSDLPPLYAALYAPKG